MAIFKAGIVALALSFFLPLASGQAQLPPTNSVRVIDAKPEGPFDWKSSPGSVIYKSETGFPDFMMKKSLPAKPYPPVPKPYSAVSNQTIATL